MEDNSQLNTSKPLLSICIPTYNREFLLKECLDSITCQFSDKNIYEQVEIVISDNASVDNTEAMVKGFQERFANIRYFKNEVTVTAGLNWDNAIQNSSGKYINIFADDDIYLQDSLPKLLPILLEELASLICFAYVELNDGKMIFSDNYLGKPTKIPADDVAEDFFTGSDKAVLKNMSLLPTFLFILGDEARAIKKTTGFFMKGPLGDHWSIFSVLHGQAAMSFYDLPMVGYRVHAQSSIIIKYVSEKNQAMIENFLKICHKDLKLFPGPSFTNLVYIGMQDIQYHFPEYRKFLINTDRLLISHMSDVFHSNFTLREKGRYLWQSFCLIKQKKCFMQLSFLTRVLKYVAKKIKFK